MYRLYLDEVGTEDLTHVEKDEHRFLSLTGVAIKLDHVQDFLIPNLQAIKSDVFRHDPDETICLHRTEILSRKGVFGRLSDPISRERFDTALMKLLWTCRYTVFTALIDKAWMLKQRHWNKNHPYHFLLEILIERYTSFLERRGDIGDIMPESRQRKPDKVLQEAFADIRQNGTAYTSASRIRRSIHSSTLKFRTKKDNIAGLQLCDLIAHPSHIYTRSQMAHQVSLGPFAQKVLDCLIEQKYHRSADGRIKGFGFKHLPQ